MKISLIMLTYNRENQVKGMLSCVKRQTFKDFEFIIINNGSTDGTYKILEDYEKEYEGTINVITINAPQSIGAARNIGIKNASGEFVAFVDDDDLIDEDYLEYLVACQKKSRADFVGCGSDEVFEDKTQIQVGFNGEFLITAIQGIEEYLKREKVRAGSNCKLIKKELIVKDPFKEDCRHEDIHTMYKYIANSECVFLSGIIKYHFIRNGKNTTSYMDNWKNFSLEQLDEYLDAYSKRTAYIDKRFPGLYELNHYSQLSYMLSMVDKIENYELKPCFFRKRKMIEILRNNRLFMENSSFTKDFEQEWLERYI